MFDEVTLKLVSVTRDKNGAQKENKNFKKVQCVRQSVSREQRDKYNDRGLTKNVRLKITLLDAHIYDTETIPEFVYKGVTYSTKDITMDTTGTSTYIEGTTVQGRA